MHTFATRTLKGNISKTNKRDVRFVSFIIVLPKAWPNALKHLDGDDRMIASTDLADTG